MRAPHIAIITALFAIPSVGYAQQDGPVGGRVGSDLSTSTTQPNALPSARAYAPPPSSGHPAGYTGAVTPGQVVPDNVQVTPRPGGMGRPSSTVTGCSSIPRIASCGSSISARSGRALTARAGRIFCRRHPSRVCYASN